MAKKRRVKYWIGQIHLWLGLASGIVVLIVSITGCLFVFQKEISERLYKKTYFIKAPDLAASTLPLSLLQLKARNALGTARPINSITTYSQPDRAWEFMAYSSNDSALTYFGVMQYSQSVFLNPYNGAVTGIRDYKYDFFSIVKYIHWSLLLNTDYGQPIVGWSTLIFVLLLITGIVLWWPKKWTRAYKDRSFKIKWGASFKRVNYDLHNVPGFYSLFPALIIAMTGMVFAFRWFSALVYVAASGTTTPPPQAIIKSVRSAADSALVQDSSDSLIWIHPAIASPMDKAFGLAQEQLPGTRRLGIYPATGAEGTIYVYGYKDGETYYGSDALQFDQYTGRLLHRRNNSEKNRGEKLAEMNYDIHVGAIGGLTGKIIAFIASLICASLPVTGFLIWWGKRRKSSYIRV
ncbi:MAG TPA: PepSY-associated TM helix domain-containing protein [Puia sp.]|nr:PepSY-associated TM helix domain-containing protein [Puia sp.]